MSVLDANARVVVVGGSLSSLRTCEGLRQGGFDGSIVVIGAEPYLPYDRPPLSKEFLSGKFDSTRLFLRAGEKLDALEVEFRLSTRASRLVPEDHAIGLESGESVEFDRLVIATGALPRILPGSKHLQGVWTIRTLDDAVGLRQALLDASCRLIVVGGGFLGMEVAATARSLGVQVTVVEPLNTPLERVLGPMIGEALAGLHRDHGVQLITGVGVAGLVGEDSVVGVELADGRVLGADAVVVAIGVVPETSWLEESGLTIDNGVVCDETLHAAPDIYAIGDVARFPHRLAGGLIRIEHWTNSAEQGLHVASSMTKGDDVAGPYSAVPYFWSDHFDLKIQAIGLPQSDDDVAIVDGSLESRRFVVCYGRNGLLAGAVGFSRPRQLMTYRKLVHDGASFDEALRLTP